MKGKPRHLSLSTPDSTLSQREGNQTVWKHILMFCGIVSSAHAATHTTPEQLATRMVEHVPLIESTKHHIQTICLALGIYKEARGEPLDGRMAVAFVILNRTKLNGLTVCGTLWEHHGREFPWVRTGTPLREQDLWQDAQSLATMMIDIPLRDNTHGATQFYNPRICRCRLPGRITTIIHNHTFVCSTLTKDRNVVFSDHEERRQSSLGCLL